MQNSKRRGGTRRSDAYEVNLFSSTITNRSIISMIRSTILKIIIIRNNAQKKKEKKKKNEGARERERDK